MRSRAMLLGAGLVVLAACGSTSADAVKTSTTIPALNARTGSASISPTTLPPTTAVPATTPATTAPATTTPATTAPTGAQDLVITDAQRQQLLDAAAALNQIPADEYTGLVKGETYYAYDPSTGDHWAGASLVPSPDSLRAQVSDQDDGSYYVFELAPNATTWQAYAVGATEEPGSTCPVTVPPAVLAVWDWKPGTCLPPS